MAEIVIFDTEYTSWEGALERQWTGENEYREIVQIGALKVDWPNGTVLDSLDILVKPLRNPKLSQYFIDLTGITQDMVDNSGIPFPEALKFFLDFCGAETPTLSYGKDFCTLAENIAINHCHPHTFYRGGPNFMNCGPAFRAADPTIREKKINSGKLWEHFKLPRPEGVGAHNALFDCHSILAGLKYLRDKKKLAL